MCIRDSKNHDPLKIELYDLDKDVSESKDLASKNPDVVKRLKKLMEEQHVPSKEFPLRVID